MMLNIKLVEIIDNATRYVPIGIFIGFIFLWEMYLIFNNNILPIKYVNNEAIIIFIKTNLSQIAAVLYTDYFIYFWFYRMQIIFW